MNLPRYVYFRRATLVHNICGNGRPLCVRFEPETQAWQAICRFHPLSDRRNEPGTAVDSTFQVLLCLGGNDTFVSTAQESELHSSPFGATVRVRR